MADILHFVDRREQTIHLENITLTVFMNAVLPRVLSEDLEQFNKILMHEHTHWEIFGGVHGRLQVQFSEQKIILEKGDVLIIRPHVKHKTVLMEEGSVRSSIPFYFRHHQVACHYDLYTRINQFVGEEECILLHDRNDICSLIEQAMDAGTSQPSPHACILMSEILMSLTAEFGKTLDAGNILENSEIGQLEKLDQIFSEYFMHPISIQYVAEKLFVSVRQLERVVKKRYNATFQDIILERRLSAAEQFLCQTELSVSSVAEKVGFQNKESFIKMFRKRKGMSPSAYRKKMQQSILQ